MSLVAVFPGPTLLHDSWVFMTLTEISFNSAPSSGDCQENIYLATRDPEKTINFRKMLRIILCVSFFFQSAPLFSPVRMTDEFDFIPRASFISSICQCQNNISQLRHVTSTSSIDDFMCKSKNQILMRKEKTEWKIRAKWVLGAGRRCGEIENSNKFVGVGTHDWCTQYVWIRKRLRSFSSVVRENSDRFN